MASFDFLAFGGGASSADSPERLSESFSDPSWLGRNELNASSVLTYMSLSPFWTPGCINDQAKALDAAQAAELSGIEYRVLPGWESTPGLFVIERTMKKPQSAALVSPAAAGASGSAAAPAAVLSVYYCLQGVIYQCPDLATLLSARIERASSQLAKAIAAMELARVASAAASLPSSSSTSSASFAPPALTAAVAARLGHDPRVDDLLRFSNY